ncbi:MAG: TatD family hydrolase [Chlamydiota bacterium]
MYIDTHAHITCTKLVGQADEIISRAKHAGVDNIINVCADGAALPPALELSKHYPNIYTAAATSPHDVVDEGEAMFEAIASYARKGRLIAIGETGLDYYYGRSFAEVQRNFLIRYMRLALECHLPLIIHCREAFSDLFDIADKEYKDAPAVVHCFTGTSQEARQALDRGWYISFSGIVTFKNSQELRNVARQVPLDRLLIETDSPYLAPQSHRGKTNEPSFLPEVASTLAELHSTTLSSIADITSHNAKKVFTL